MAVFTACLSASILAFSIERAQLITVQGFSSLHCKRSSVTATEQFQRLIGCRARLTTATRSSYFTSFPHVCGKTPDKKKIKLREKKNLVWLIFWRYNPSWRGSCGNGVASDGGGSCVRQLGGHTVSAVRTNTGAQLALLFPPFTHPETSVHGTIPPRITVSHPFSGRPAWKCPGKPRGVSSR